MDILTTTTFLLLGLGNGAVFAALGVSVAISYRTSNVINFGAGAMALFGAVTFQALRTEHSVFNPLAASTPLTAVVAAGGLVAVLRRWRKNTPGPSRVMSTAVTFLVLTGLALAPTFIDVGGNVPTGPALLATFVICAATGLALYAGIFRHLRNSLPLTQAVATIGLLLALPAIVTNRLGNSVSTISVPKIFPNDAWKIGDLTVYERQIIMAACVFAVAVLLAVVYRRTKFGLQTATAAETDTGATILGISPHRIGGANWAICGSVAGVFGALIVSFAPVSPNDFALFVISGLAAAMLGRMSSIGWATAGGLAIGMLESEAQYQTTRHAWLPQQGLADFVPLILLVVVMVFRSKALPERGALIKRSLPAAPTPTHVRQWGVALTAASIVAAVTLKGNYQVALAATLIAVLLALSLMVLTGLAGQISLAQFMFAGVAGFLLSRFSVTLGIPFPFAPLLAVVAVVAFGVLVSLPAVRVRGVNLAILTLAAGVTVESFYFSNADYVGNGGSPTVAKPSLLGLQLSIGSSTHYPRFQFALMLVVVVVPMVLGVVGLRRSALGLQMLAVRANERAAAANGVDVARIKMLAFAISAFIAGVAGVFTAYMNFGGISSASFDVFLSVTLVASVYVAGISMVSGSILAALVSAGGLVTLLVTNLFSSVTEWYPVFAGVSLVFSAIAVPEGVAGKLAANGPPRLLVTMLATLRPDRKQGDPSHRSDSGGNVMLLAGTPSGTPTETRPLVP